MAAATPLRAGQVNSSGATDALFLKVFGGEILTAFEQSQVVVDKHTVRQISHGKSAQFPATWKVSAAYHTAGAEILGQTSNLNERVIAIDDQLIASVAIPSIDEAMNHYDYRSIYSRECGIELANTWDRNVLQVGVNAARASATVTGGDGGTVLTSSGTLYRTSSSDLAAGIYSGIQAMDEKNNPDADGRNVFMRPAQYYLLAQDKTLYNTDYAAGNGNFKDGAVFQIGGAKLVKTNNFPITNISTGPTSYQGNFALTVGLLMSTRAVGTVKLLDLAQEMSWDMRRQVTLLLAKYAIGHGILRPEAAVELKTTS